MMVSIENIHTWQNLGFAPVELARLFNAARGGFDEHKCSHHKRYYGRHRVIRSQMFDKNDQRRPFDFIFIPILRRLYFTELMVMQYRYWGNHVLEALVFFYRDI